MDLPASFYGELDERNPVLISFERDVKSFVVLMRQVASSTNRDNSSHAKGWDINKPRLLPLELIYSIIGHF